MSSRNKVGRPPKTELLPGEVRAIREELLAIFHDRDPRTFQTIKQLIEHYQITYYWLKKIYGDDIFRGIGPSLSRIPWEDLPTRSHPAATVTRSQRDEIRSLYAQGELNFSEIKEALGLEIETTAISRIARGYTFQEDLEE